jgi:hypothetical protein
MVSSGAVPRSKGVNFTNQNAAIDGRSCRALSLEADGRATPVESLAAAFRGLALPETALHSIMCATSMR